MVLSQERGLCSAIDSQQASVNTKKMHAIYAHFYLGFTVAKVARIYRKGIGTISRWINRYRETGNVSRCCSKSSHARFQPEQRQWILDYVLRNPLSFLDETRRAFILEWRIRISISSIWRIMSELKLTYKVRVLSESDDIMNLSNEALL
jgi:transposase